jgi:hypothetical protein
VNAICAIGSVDTREIVEAGCTGPLVALLRSNETRTSEISTSVASTAVGILSSISGDERNLTAIAEVNDAVPALVSMIKSASSRKDQLYATMILQRLVSHSKVEHSKTITESDGIPVLVSLLGCRKNPPSYSHALAFTADILR